MTINKKNYEKLMSFVLLLRGEKNSRLEGSFYSLLAEKVLKELEVDCDNKNDKLDLIKKYISLQAEDEGLWFKAETVTEAYLQRELRRLAYIIEIDSVEYLNKCIADRINHE